MRNRSSENSPSTPTRRHARLAAAGLLAWIPAAGVFAEGVDCVIEPALRARVSSVVPGVLEAIEVDRGDFVEAGQRLAKLESSIEQATLAMARARAASETTLRTGQVRLELGSWELDRIQQLRDRDIASERESRAAETTKQVAELELRAAQDEHELAQLELARAEAALARRSIRSPISGVVVEVAGSPGEYFEEQPIFELAQLDPLHVEAFVPLARMGEVETGMVATVRPEDPIGGTLAATVVVVDRVVDAASGTFGVRLELPNPEHRVPAGLRCRVEFGTGVELGALP